MRSRSCHPLAGVEVATHGPGGGTHTKRVLLIASALNLSALILFLLCSSLAAAEGSVTLYYFYGADCPHCQAFHSRRRAPRHRGHHRWPALHRAALPAHAGPVCAQFSTNREVSAPLQSPLHRTSGPHAARRLPGHCAGRGGSVAKGRSPVPEAHRRRGDAWHRCCDAPRRYLIPRVPS